jgi:AraC family transcriptional regulator of adaptative response / DNA-3-methyladenine glycosylase II
MRFLPTAAAAQRQGFRACKRCRPDASPGSPEWDLRGDVVARAVRLIADGVVDRDGVGGLATHLGYSVRQLERVVRAELGTGPLALARAQRAQQARILIETTSMPFTEVAFAAGFSSVRQFNDTVRSVFDTAPSALRRRAHRRGIAGQGRGGSLAVRLPLRTPWTPTTTFDRLAATALDGCAEHRDGRYRCAMRLPHGSGIVGLAPSGDHVTAHLEAHDMRDIPTMIARCRRLLDLDNDPVAIDGVLSEDPALRPLVARTPGARVLHHVDDGELVARAVLGQQVSAKAAHTHLTRLVDRWGSSLDAPVGGVTRLFPDIETLAEIDPATLAVPAARRRCFAALTQAVASGHIDLGPGADRAHTRARLAELPGVGQWTVELLALRGLADPDAFPANDRAVRSAAARRGLPDHPLHLQHHADAWRPWRSYASELLRADATSTPKETRT